MGLKNKIEAGHIHFLTMTVIDWVDVFTRPNHKMTIVDSLKHCQKKKGLEIYAWVLMSNHLHMIAAAADDDKNTLSDILRDFKKFTSKKIVDNIITEPESRGEWMLGNEPKVIITNAFFLQKLNYIHQNPVRQMICGPARRLSF